MKIVPLVFAFVLVAPACKGTDRAHEQAAPIEAGGLSPFGGGRRSVDGDDGKGASDDKDGAKAEQEAKGSEAKGDGGARHGTPNTIAPDASEAEQKGERGDDGGGAKADTRPREPDSGWANRGPVKSTPVGSESKQDDADSGAAKGNGG